MDADERALRVSARGFGGQPDCTSFRLEVDPGVDLWADEMVKATHVSVKARAGQPDTTRVELVLLEKDGSPWGTNLSLTREWQAIKIPLSEFRYFSHWRAPEGGRGGEGDHLRPQDLRQANFCFGAWLYGEKASSPHAFAIQDVCLETRP
jgi:hypothetical protein